MGYHTKNIEKGIIGEFSKIKEEFQELEDAKEQNNPVLQICELCDLIGAIELYAKNMWELSLEDLIKMKECTKESFEEGKRT